MISRRFKSILCLLTVFLIICTSILNPLVVSAGKSKETTFKSSNVLDDLLSSVVNGQVFDIKNFSFNEKGNLQILNFIEYCYSYKESKQDDFGLYVYVFNPQGLDIDKTSKQNKIQLATYSDEFGEHFDKFELEFINEPNQSNFKGLFYKFKVVDKEGTDGKTLIDRVNSNERVYKVSGIELLTKGNSNATEYGIGGTYKFTGYAKGYGPDAEAESTLNCSVETLETLSLDVHHTNYRTGVSSLGSNHYNEVNTVYFSVPDRIFEEYGNLQKIRAEWWEYKTRPALITKDIEIYNELIKHVGKDVGTYDSSIKASVYGNSSIYISSSGAFTRITYDWCWNKDIGTSFGKEVESNKIIPMIPYVFHAPKASDVDGIFKFLYSSPVAGPVEGTQIADYIYKYSNNLGRGYIDCNGRNISKDLFENDVDSGRTMGYNDKTIDLGDTFDLNSYDSNHTWWNKLWDYGFSWPDTSGDYKNIAPIYELKASDLAGSDEEISSKILVNEDEVSELKSFYTQATANNEKVILFRFANTDYYCEKANVVANGKTSSDTSYIAQQTVFFDFDIIELTFNKDGVYYVIPAVSSPSDIVNGFTPPPEEFEWWKLLLALLILVLIIVIIAPIMPLIVRFLLTIIKCIIMVIMLPFKLIWKAIKKKRDKDKDN